MGTKGGRLSVVWLTPKAVARQLSVSVTTVYRLIEIGDIPAIKVGRQYRINANCLSDTLLELRVVDSEEKRNLRI